VTQVGSHGCRCPASNPRLLLSLQVASVAVLATVPSPWRLASSRGRRCLRLARSASRTRCARRRHPANACGHWAPAAHTFAIEPGNDVVASFKAVAVEGRSVALREEADGDAPGAIRA